MEPWQILLAIFGVTTIVVSGVVRIFTNGGAKKLRSEDSGPKRLGASADDVHDVDKRLAVLEQKVEGQGRELGETKKSVTRLDREQQQSINRLGDKVTKLSDLLIEWVQKSGRR